MSQHDHFKRQAQNRFLEGGGEMGERMRTYDWSKTNLGPVDTWPQSLCTTLSIILNTKFPMFLWWGEELIQFYNDAYRPSLGIDGKHPKALGQRGEECWTEIWPAIKPMIDQVRNEGEATWNEDQLIPIYRNGKLEDVYWTFGYSPVYDESGDVGGVLVVCNETTDQVKQFQQLQFTYQRFQNLVRNVPIGIIVLSGEEMKVEVVNEAYGKLVDKSCDQLMGNPLFDVIPEGKKPFYPILHQVLTSGEPVYLQDHPYEKAGKDEEHKTGYLNLVYQAYIETDERISGVMVLCHEVTEQVLARKKIEENEKALKRFKFMADQARDPLILIREDGSFAYLNQRALEAWGYTEEEARHIKVPDVDPIYQHELFTDLFTKAQKENIPQFETLHQQKDGHIFPVEVTVVGISLNDMPHMFVIARNISKRKKTEAALIESEERFRIMADASPNMIWAINPDGSYKYMNSFALDFLGIMAEDLDQQKWDPHLYIHADDVEDSQKKINEAFNDRKPYSQELRIRRKDGEYRWLLSKGAPSYFPNGELYAYVGSSIDITDLKLSEASLKDKNIQLVRINNDLDNFIYTASHDLKAPISNIEGLMHALLHTLSPQNIASKRVQHITNMILESVERFKKTIGNLTDVVKLQKEHNEDAIMVELNQVIKDVCLDLDQLIKTNNAQMDIQIEKSFSIHFSEKNLRSVIYNLISNAIKYKSPHRKPSVLIQCISIPGYHLLSIKDNGLGMERKRLGQLFTMFKRFHNHVEGTGIGLYMIKKMVENAGGKIEVESELGQGSTFKVYFPR